MTNAASRLRRDPELEPRDVAAETGRARRSGLYVDGRPKPLTRCEIRLDGAWQAGDVALASRTPAAALRCPSCHGALTLHRVYHGQGGAHFRHVQAHDGCPEHPVRFSGTASQHPMALR